MVVLFRLSWTTSVDCMKCWKNLFLIYLPACSIACETSMFGMRKDSHVTLPQWEDIPQANSVRVSDELIRLQTPSL